MSKKRGRPKTSTYDAAFHLRLTKHDLATLKYEFDRYCVALGQYDKRGHRKSLNDYLLKKLKR